MTYVLISFLVLMTAWMIFGNRHILYGLSIPPMLLFCINGHALYGTVIAILTLYLVNIKDSEATDFSKYKRYKIALVALLFCSLPIIIKRIPADAYQKHDENSVMMAIIIGVIVTFLTACLTILAGIKRTKGDKSIHE